MLRQKRAGNEQQNPGDRARNNGRHAARFHVADNAAGDRQRAEDDEVKFNRIHNRGLDAFVIQQRGAVQLGVVAAVC